MRASHIRTACMVGVLVALGVAACSFGPATYNGPNVPPAPVDSGTSEDAGVDAASEDSSSGEDVSSGDSSPDDSSTATDSGGGLDGSAG
jgi:hypothetical protein